MQVDGVRAVGTKRVALDAFFEKPTFVEIRILSPYAKAQIREVLMSSFEIGDVDAKGAKANVTTRSAGQADRDMKMRELKLVNGVTANNITVGGANAEWGKELWDALDEANPRILETVLESIDAISREVNENPT
jgi:hypothetical protein